MHLKCSHSNAGARWEEVVLVRPATRGYGAREPDGVCPGETQAFTDDAAEIGIGVKVFVTGSAESELLLETGVSGWFSCQFSIPRRK